MASSKKKNIPLMTPVELMQCARTWVGKTPFGTRLSLVEAFALFQIGNPIAICGQWAVTEDGVECLVSEYFIERDRVKVSSTEEWMQHMARKTWTDMVDFAFAWQLAVKAYAQ